VAIQRCVTSMTVWLSATPIRQRVAAPFGKVYFPDHHRGMERLVRWLDETGPPGTIRGHPDSFVSLPERLKETSGSQVSKEARTSALDGRATGLVPARMNAAAC
jgi:hypothetical protein